jgi:prevent-host-death family protein
MATKTRTVNLYEAKTRLSKLVDEAAAGAEIVIAKAGKAKARLVPLEKARSPRRSGGWEGRLWVADDFDDDLPADVLGGFVSPPDEAE